MMNAVLIHFVTYNTDALLKTQNLGSCRYLRGAFMEERLW